MRESPDRTPRPSAENEFSGPERRGTSFSLLSLAATALRHGRLILLCGFGFSLLAAGRRAIQEAKYTSTAVFMTERSSGVTNQTIQLASRLGLVNGSSSISSPVLLRELLVSRVVLDSVGGGRYEVMRGDSLTVSSLAELLEIEPGNEFRRTRRIRAWLRSAVNVRRDVASGFIHVSASTPWPRVSQGVVARMLEEVDRFNVHIRQSSAHATQAFIEDQMRLVVADLSSAQAALQTFREQNRSFGSWSPLSAELDRLDSEVRRQRVLYESLTTTYANAQIEAKRDTPVITVIQDPFLPHRPDSRGLALGSSSGFVAGCLIAFLAVLVMRHYMHLPDSSRQELIGAARDLFAQIPFLRRLVSR